VRTAGADGSLGWQMDVTDGVSWLMAVPCLNDAGTGELRQVYGISWQVAAILCLHGCKWQVSCDWHMAICRLLAGLLIGSAW